MATSRALSRPSLRSPRLRPALPRVTPTLKRGWIVALALSGLSAVLAVVLWQPPASLLDTVVSRLTEGRVRLSDASGTVWNGRARIVLADLRESAVQAEAAGGRVTIGTVPGMAIPGAFAWKVSPAALLIGRLDVRIEHDSMAQPVQLSGRIGEWQATPGALMLPAMSLERLGSPWTTIRPTGSLAITWDALTVRDGRFEGRVAIELSHAASALTPVRPLGAYRVQVVGSGSQADLTMHTLSGPLLLEGKGRWNARSGLQFLAEARAEESEKLRLMPLLGLLGRREGERTLIKIGA